MTVVEPQPGSAARTAHVDTFVRDNLPPPEDWPTLLFDLPGLQYPGRLNAAVELCDRTADAGHASRPALRFEGQVVTYDALSAWSNRIAGALVHDLGLRPGERVLIRGFNNPTFVACWLGVLKAGGVVVSTMPLLRARELGYILEKARVRLALCDARLVEEMRVAAERASGNPDLAGLRTVLFGSGAGANEDSLEALAAARPDTFDAVDTAADDPAIIAFTSGTTGQPKGAVHNHRDLLATCDTYGAHILRTTPDDISCGTPPLAFTYGLGGLVLFPLRAGASTVLIEKPSPEGLLQAIQDNRATMVFTSPTMYRGLIEHVGRYDIASLRACVSAGETLPLATFQDWQDATGVTIMDGIGSTEMLHIFIAAPLEEIRPGATGRAVPGYEARVVDENGNPLPPGEVGRLAVRGPTGCTYLADPERQRTYVQGGWNFTGDAYRVDEDGYFWYQARADDMIISAGYNIAGPEVENVLLEHPKVKECAVVASPDPARTFIVKAFVILRDPADASDATVRELQDFVKAQIAPYKYPRAVEFVDSFPRTETGKLQRYRLRELEMERARARGA